MLLLVAVYAGCYTAIKLGLGFAPPLRFAGLRAVIAGGALVVILGLRGQALTPPRQLWRWLPAVAASGTVLAYAAMFLSPGRTPAGIASVLGNTTPLFVIALGGVVLGERITSAKRAALLFGFV
jgi:drug/metabolite transporter (DMT)-like permease